MRDEYLKEAQKIITIAKVKGTDNPADLGTKHLPEDVLVHHIILMGASFQDGRADHAPKLMSLSTPPKRTLRRARNAERDHRGWKEVADGVWQKLFKSARAVRTTDQYGPRWEKVRRCRVEDHCAGEILVDAQVCRMHHKDAALTSRLSHPRDLRVTLEVQS